MADYEFKQTGVLFSGRASGISLALVGAVFMVATLGSSPAAAGIKCDGAGYQIVGGNRLATPYCQDALLARVAREYGTKVSARRIRNNPNLKRDVCRLVGQDIRVQENCRATTPRPHIRF